jgi:hypothetical protein
LSCNTGKTFCYFYLSDSHKLLQINEFGRKIFVVVVLNMFVCLSTVKVYYVY